MPLAGIRLCGCIQCRSCLDVTTCEASLNVGLLHVNPFLFHSARWYACRACLRHPLAFYVSLHACLHVHAWVLLASVSSMLQYNEAMDIRSKPIFASRGHHLSLFAILLCFPFCLHPGFYLCHVYHPWLVMLVSCLYLCIYAHGARTYGARAQSPRHKQKRRGCEHANIS